MEKLVYLIRGSEEASGDALRDVLMGPGCDALARDGAERIAVNVGDSGVAAGGNVTIRKDRTPIRAMLSFWMQNSDDRAGCEAVLDKVLSQWGGEGPTRLDGYLVVESIPLVNGTSTAPTHERTPGVNMVTCIRRLPDLDDDAFLHRWYTEHKKVALETQSTFAYVRNTVVRPVTPDAPIWDGIVEEGFPIGALADPMVWYDTGGDADLLKERIQGMVASVQAFLDLSVLESTPMSEYLLG